MSFKYNDKLVIRDREQMEDLFKHRLKLFDEVRTKTISFTNNTGKVLHLKGTFDRSKNTLNLVIEENPRMAFSNDKDVDLILDYGGKAQISLMARMDLED